MGENQIMGNYECFHVSLNIANTYRTSVQTNIKAEAGNMFY